MEKSSITCAITVNNKKYFYTIKKYHNESVYIECKSAEVAMECLNEDIPRIVFSLPKLIIETQKPKEKNNEPVIRFRVTKEEKIEIQKRALERGYKDVSRFLKAIALM